MKKSLLLILPLLLFACKEKARQGGGFGVPVTYDLTSTIADEELFAKHPELKVMGDDLLLMASVTDIHTGIIKIFSLSDEFREVNSYGSRGRGPKEFLSPIMRTVVGNKVFIENTNMSEIIELEVSGNGDEITEVERKEYNYNDEKMREKLPENFIHVEPHHPVRLESGYFAGISPMGNHDFFSLWDENLNFVTYFGDAPIPEKFDLIVGMTQLSGHLDSQGDRFAFAGYYMPYIAMYEMVDGKPTKKWSKYFLEPKYAAQDGEFVAFRSKNYGAVISMTMGPKHIFLAFMDKFMGEINSPTTRAFNSNIILVFDYDGNPVARLNLDQRVESIAVSPDEKALYSVAAMPEYRLAKYKLPALK